MREIHDFDAVKNWRWQITFQGDEGFVHSSVKNRYRKLRSWLRHKHVDPGDLLLCDSIGSVIFGADFCELLRRPNFVTIRMIERGSLLVLVDRRRLLHFDAGEICLMPLYRDYAEAPSDTACRNHYVTMHGALLPEILHGLRLDEICGIRPPSMKHFEKLLERGFALPRDNSAEAHAANAGFCLELLQMLSHWRTDAALPPELAAATEFIDRHLAEPLAAGRLAAAAGCPVVRLYRLFRDVLKTSPRRYVIERRMEFARRSLRKGMSVKEIAQACGYRTPFNFSAEFKKFHGVSPRGFLSSAEGRPPLTAKRISQAAGNHIR